MTRSELRLLPQNVHTPQQWGEWRTKVYRTLAQHLEQQGLHLTAQRKAIVEALMQARNHVGLEELYERLRKRHAGIGRATVFRTLKLLEQTGLVSRVSNKDGAGCYELKQDRPHHDHLICMDCGVIIEFQSPEMERYQNAAVAEEGFEMLWHRHEIFGRCRRCRRDH